jgi:hypothetical protein
MEVLCTAVLLLNFSSTISLPAAAEAAMPHRHEVPRSLLIRDLLVFNLKLWMDGLKDILLAPLSVGAGIMDIMSGNRGPGARFYSIVRLGERFDLWLNLYGAANRDGHRLRDVFNEFDPAMRVPDPLREPERARPKPAV